MFLTLTPNAVLDKILFIEQFTPGVPIQTTDCFTGVGGKGLDASVAFRHLGQETTGLCCLAGPTGQDLLKQLERYGIRPETVWVAGETRTAFILAEKISHVHTHIFSGGLVIQDEQYQALLTRLGHLLAESCWLLTGGTLPAGIPDDFFRQVTAQAHLAGVPILIDSWRRPMLACLPARPDIAKMNRDEFGWTFDVPAKSLPGLIEIAQRVYIEYALNALVITCGADGILAFTPQGCFHAQPPAQEAINAAGAGDCASATLAWRLSLGEDWSEALRWAAAVSAASVLTQGTSDFHMEDVLRLIHNVKLKTL